MQKLLIPLLTLLIFSSSLLFGKTLVTVNGHQITDSLIPPQYDKSDKIKYDKLITDLIKREVIHAELLKSPLIKSAKFNEIFTKQKNLAMEAYKQKTGKILNQEQIRAIKGDIAIAVYQENQFKNTFLDPNEIRNFYNNNPDTFNVPDAILIANIVFQDQNEATRVLNTLKTSKNIDQDFKNMAKQYPQQVNGGWLTRNNAPANLFNTVYQSNKQQLINTPVATENGYHVIFLIDKKSAEVLPFEKVKERIEVLLKQKKVIEALDSKVQNLYGQAEIIIN
jgi:parvulin-like peptidyl-prolyl isomerase